MDDTSFDPALDTHMRECYGAMYKYRSPMHDAGCWVVFYRTPDGFGNWVVLVAETGECVITVYTGKFDIPRGDQQ